MHEERAALPSSRPHPQSPHRTRKLPTAAAVLAAVSLTLVLAVPPAAADHDDAGAATIHDEGTLFLGSPAPWLVDARVSVLGHDVGSSRTYHFFVDEPVAAADVELRYDANWIGNGGGDLGACTKGADLDVFLHGPDGSAVAALTGCDAGVVKGEAVLARGAHTLEVRANWGMNADVAGKCGLLPMCGTKPQPPKGVHYVLDLLLS